MYANGRGVAKDEVRAVVFFTQACTGHFASGCASLGTAYENGRGVEKNLTRAVSFYDQACEHGFAPACHRLGGMYESGRGVAKDEARAATLYQRACEAGYTSGCTSLSAIYASGRVTPPAKSSPAAPAPPRSNPPAAIPPTTGRATTPPAGSVPERSAASGTAFAVSPHVLLTAHHIIDGRAFVAIRCAGGKTYPVTVTARAPLVDLAVLQVASNVTLSTYLPVGDEPAVLGQHVFTIGYPAPSVLGLEPKFTEGSISSQAGPGGDASFLQVSVPVQPGNSGGALLNDKGQVVGVMVSIAAPAAFLKDTGSLPQNISWAVKIALASPLLARTPAVDAPRATSFSREQLIANATAASCLVVALPRAPTAPK
jgi:S1-C subfamily serine protease